MPSIYFLPSLRPYNDVIMLMEGVYMSFKLSKFTLRIDSDLLQKFRFIAEYNARSANREIELLIRKHIQDFEKKHGKIELK